MPNNPNYKGINETHCKGETMKLEEATRLLKNHYQDDVLDANDIREDWKRWVWVDGDKVRFPNADREFIARFNAVAEIWWLLTFGKEIA